MENNYKLRYHSTMLDIQNPHPDALALSEKLKSHINEKIHSHHGLLNFSKFMELCLYAPSLGYYAVGHEKIGPTGDFVTAPQISPLFCHCIARQTLQVLEQVHQGNILEFGAGTGEMASEILLYLEKQNSLPDNYFILEISPDLQQRQRQLIQQKCPHLLGRVTWLQHSPQKLSGVIIANEVLDAMPVHRFAVTDKKIEEYFVTLKENAYAWQLSKPVNETLNERISLLKKNNFDAVMNYSSEISLLIPHWIKTLSENLQEGVILIIDYGFPEHEYYHPQRSMGTLMCHYQHRAHDNPLIFPGLQDITAHVDFTQVAQSAVEAGLDLLGYTTQGFFLLSCGILELIPKVEREQIQANQAIKKLTLPHEMGELFKVIALGRGINQSLMGFTTRNLRERL